MRRLMLRFTPGYPRLRYLRPARVEKGLPIQLGHTLRAARGVTHQTGREFTARISQWPKALPLSVWGNARLRAPPANPINRSIRITVKCPIMAEPGSGIRQSARLTHFDYLKIKKKGTGFACVVLSLDPIFKNSEYDCILLFS